MSLLKEKKKCNKINTFLLKIKGSMHITGLKPELVSTNQENTQNKNILFFLGMCARSLSDTDGSTFTSFNSHCNKKSAVT